MPTLSEISSLSSNYEQVKTSIGDNSLPKQSVVSSTSVPDFICKLGCLFFSQCYVNSEIISRVFLIAAFLLLEDLDPFERVVHSEEWWYYQNPYYKHHTISWSFLYQLIAFVPVLTACLFSGVFYSTRRNDIIPFISSFSLAFLLNGILTNVLKASMGKLRPDFYSRCFPGGSGPFVLPSGLDELDCVGLESIVREGRRSFPSAHTSYAFTCLGFCSIYIASKFHCFDPRGKSSSFKLITAMAPLTIALFIGVSRTSDYKSHSIDVVCGGLLGILIAYTSYRQHYPPLTHELAHLPFAMLDVQAADEQVMIPEVPDNKSEVSSSKEKGKSSRRKSSFKKYKKEYSKIIDDSTSSNPPPAPPPPMKLQREESIKGLKTDNLIPVSVPKPLFDSNKEYKSQFAKNEGSESGLNSQMKEFLPNESVDSPIRSETSSSTKQGSNAKSSNKTSSSGSGSSEDDSSSSSPPDQ